MKEEREKENGVKYLSLVKERIKEGKRGSEKKKGEKKKVARRGIRRDLRGVGGPAESKGEKCTLLICKLRVKNPPEGICARSVSQLTCFAGYF